MYILFFIFWLIMNGKITVEICLLGLALLMISAGFIYLLFGYTPAKDFHNILKLPIVLIFMLVVIQEVIKSNLAVIKIVLNGKEKIAPTLITFRPDLKTNFGRYLLATAITLTPGTITVSIVDDIYTVHCLREEFMDTSDQNVFIRWIKKLED